jgi:hypothetical protein
MNFKAFSLFFFLTIFSVAQTQTIRGRVLDKDSKYQLVGANIILVGSDPLIGAVSDEKGEFKLLNVPIGRQALKITYLGYAEAYLPNIIVNTGKETILTIEMIEQVYTSEEVIISAKKAKSEVNNEMATVSARSFDIEETSRYAGSLNDPARMATNFAGVSGSNDARNDIIIRGNSPLGLLWRLEGVDIPNPNHFANAGSTGGPISILNNNVLDRSDFMTGAFPANYGNALSGVFDLQMRPGNNEKREYMGQFGFNGFEMGAEGPLSKKNKGSYICNYRYANLSIFKELGINLGAGDAVPVYQDISFKIDLPTNKKGRFTLWGIGGNSYIQLKSGDSKEEDMFTQNGFDTYYTTKMGVIGASHLYYFNEKTYGKLNFAITGSDIKISQDSVSFLDNSRTAFFGSTYAQTKMTVNYQLVKKINAKNTWQSGFFIDRYYFNNADSLKTGSFYRKIIDFSGELYLMQAFTQWQYRFTDKLQLITGLHFQQLTNNATYALEPRIGLNWDFSKRQSFSLGTGLHSQMQPAFLYFYQTRLADGSYIKTNEKLGFTRSFHVVGGYQNRVTENFRIKSEVYYQNLDKVPVEINPTYFSMLNAGAGFGIDRRDSLENKGLGYNYGLELTLERFFSKGFYFLFTTSLFESKYQGSDKIWRNTAFNGNYVFNALVGKEINLSKKVVFALDYRVTYAGGRRYVPIDLEASRLENEAVFIGERAFENKLKDYFRTDIKASIRLNSKKITQEWILSVQNFTNTKNVFQQVYVPLRGDLVTQYQLGIFPVVQYKILF